MYHDYRRQYLLTGNDYARLIICNLATIEYDTILKRRKK